MEQNDISKWLRGIAYEIAFWNNVYRWKWTFQGMMNWSHYGKAIDLELFDANAFLATLDNAQLLDVGCGMSYVTGNHVKEGDTLRPIPLHYVDALAPYFNKILKKRKKDLPAIEFGMVEYLSAFYSPGSVDMVIIQNALDHSAQPVKGILESLHVLKEGGVLYLNHHPNEAETEHYKGFHQYNIDERDGQLIVWNRQSEVNVNHLVASFADIEVKRHANSHIVAILRKKGEVGADAITTADDRKALCEMLILNNMNATSIWQSIRYRFSFWWYNSIQFVAQALPWKWKMGIKKMIGQENLSISKRA